MVKITLKQLYLSGFEDVQYIGEATLIVKYAKYIVKIFYESITLTYYSKHELIADVLVLKVEYEYV